MRITGGEDGSLAIRRYGHEEILEAVGLGAVPAWLETVRESPEEEPVGIDIIPTLADITLVAVLFDCDAWTEPPEAGICLVVPRPNGVFWTTLKGMEGFVRRWRAPRPAGWFWSNRRRGYRVPMDQPTDVRLGKEALTARFRDVSTTGCRLRIERSAESLPVGMELRVRLPFGADLWAEGEVVRVVPDGGAAVVGVRWRSLSFAVDQQLANFVFAREREALRRGHPRRR